MGEDISFSGQSQVFCTLEIDIKELLEENRVLGDGVYAMQYYNVCQTSVSKLIWQISSNNHSNV